MNLSVFKNHLKDVSEVVFLKSDNETVPKHFHITEVGQIDKRFIDCGGTVRNEKVISMQLWESVDFWHRLEPSKLLDIIELSERKLGIEDVEVEVEYQGETIGKFGVDFQNNQFKLVAKTTTCLAIDSCGVPFVEKVKNGMFELTQAATSCCTPGGGCC